MHFSPNSFTFTQSLKSIRFARASILLILMVFFTGCQHPRAKSKASCFSDEVAPFFPDSTSVLEYNAYRAFEVCLDVIAHNIANANTTGYKRSRVEIQELVGQSVAPSDSMSFQKTPLRQGSQAVCVRRIFSNGNTVYTGERLDIAIVGKGFFEVQMPDGTRAYTRDGSFKMASDGRITTLNGMPLQNGFQPIASGTTSINISSNGEVTCQSADGTHSFQVQLCQFANPTGLEAVRGNFFKETESSGIPEISNPGDKGSGFLVQDFLESSNVSISEEMFELARARTACKALIEVAKARRLFGVCP
jgi:flagellar basal-body rod protein FlgG